MLEQERSVFDQHLAEWLTTYKGKFALIKGDEVVGFFDTGDAALAEGARRFGLTSFLVRPIQEVQEPVVIPALMLGLLNVDTQRAVSHPPATGS
jgi:hypothetical protein